MASRGPMRPANVLTSPKARSPSKRTGRSGLKVSEGLVVADGLVALVVSGALFPLVLAGLMRGFAVVRPGAFVATEAATLHVVMLAGGALATGLAVGAPVAAAVLVVDCFLGLASRAAPQLNLQEVGAPLRILGGGALLWLGTGVFCERLLAGVLSTEGALALLGEVAR